MPASKNAADYHLRVTAGPSYDPSTHQLIHVNTSKPVTIKSEHIDVKVNVRIQNYRGNYAIHVIVPSMETQLLVGPGECGHLTDSPHITKQVFQPTRLPYPPTSRTHRTHPTSTPSHFPFPSQKTYRAPTSSSATTSEILSAINYPRASELRSEL